MDAVEMGDEVRPFNLDEWIISMSNPEATEHGTALWRIEKIPALLKRDKHNEQEYEPKVVSLGPYQHKKPELQLAEKFKEKSLKIYCSANDETIHHLSNMVRGEIEYVRSCNVEGSTDEYSDDELTKMMVLDGCFILNVVDCVVSETTTRSCDDGLEEMQEFKPFTLSDGPKKSPVAVSYQERLGGLVWANIFSDIYLLENQIPYLVLLKLGAKAETINSFVNLTIHRQIENVQAVTDNPHHLLEIYRNCFLSRSSYDGFEYDNNNHKITRYTHSFRLVMELKQKGIRFRPSSTTSLTDIKFTSFGFYGQLELPRRLITFSTKAIFLNLIAYEMCPYTPNDYSVTSYVGFMKSLINDSNDVKELRSKHIILNKLESDVELAKMFEEISIPTVNNRFFEGVKERIQEHYTSKAKTWMAELNSLYFNSPWSTTALLAAILLLVLTFLQTFFAIFPKYSNK